VNTPVWRGLQPPATGRASRLGTSGAPIDCCSPQCRKRAFVRSLVVRKLTGEVIED